MKRRTFLLALIGPFALAIVLIVGVCGVVIYWQGERSLRLEQQEQLDRLLILVRPWVNQKGDLGQDDLTRLAGAATALDARITLIGGDGTVLFDSLADPAHMENHNQRPEVIAARSGAEGRSVRFSDTLHQDAINVARLVDPGNPGGPVLRMSYPRSLWRVLSPAPWPALTAAIALALVMSIWLAMVLRRRWVGPVLKMADAAERMAAGDWTARVESRGAEDVRMFASKFNTLAEHAQQQLSDLNGQRQDLRALVDTLPDPIIVTDAQQRIVLVNSPAATLLALSAEEVIGRKAAAVVSDAPILDLVDELSRHATGKVSDPAEVQRGVKLTRHGQRLTYQAYGAQTAGGGTLLVMRDVTTLAQAVQMKTDFVANASHELRTPIAAIKIAFETLRDVYTEDPEQTARCVQIIDGHLHRLEEMLRDLLDLSRVEGAEAEPQRAQLRAADLFSAARTAMASIARQKQIELVFEDRTNGATILSDERLLNLVLKNLIENSVKFTPAGGKVTATVLQEGAWGGITVSVADTGIGIAPEHLDRVFERFYQADPARSGSAGRGTGLGLAIVKHAVAALGGTVNLKSAVGVGTTVTFTLPQTVT